MSLSLEQVTSWAEAKIDQTHNGDADFNIAGTVEDGTLILVTREDYNARTNQAWKITVEAL